MVTASIYQFETIFEFPLNKSNDRAKFNTCKTLDFDSLKSCYLKTRLKCNKAGHTATPGACGWAGAVFEVT